MEVESVIIIATIICSAAAGPFPLHAITRNTGLEFGLAVARDFDGTSIHQNVRTEWRVAFEGLPNALDNRKATSWDTQAVCLQYLGGASTFDSCLVPGSPYMTFTFNNAAVTLTSVKGNANFQWVTEGKNSATFGLMSLLRFHFIFA